MIARVVTIKRQSCFSEAKDNLAFWLKKTPRERIEAVEYLRRQFYGNSARLQRIARIVKRERDFADIEALGDK